MQTLRPPPVRQPLDQTPAQPFEEQPAAPSRQPQASKASERHAAEDGSTVPIYDLRSTWRTPKRDEGRLTAALTTAPHCEALLELVATQRDTFNSIHLTAALKRTVQVTGKIIIKCRCLCPFLKSLSPHNPKCI